MVGITHPHKLGLTVAELIVAIGVLAIATLSLVAVLGSGLKQIRQAEQVTTATQIARSFLEQTKSVGLAAELEASEYDGRLNDPVHPTGFPGAPYPRVSKQGREYALRVLLRDRADGTRGIIVQVWWGETHKVSLETQLARI